MALDHANKQNADAQRAAKKHGEAMRELQVSEKFLFQKRELSEVLIALCSIHHCVERSACHRLIERS